MLEQPVDAPALETPSIAPHQYAGARDVDSWFKQEVMPLGPALKRYMECNWRKSADIPDLMQEVLVRVYEGGRQEIPRSTKAILFQIARNLLIDSTRRAAVRAIEMQVDMGELVAPVDDLSPEMEVASRQEFRLFLVAFRQLPAHVQEAICLRRLEGLSQRETARRMGKSEKSIENYMQVGLHALAAVAPIVAKRVSRFSRKVCPAHQTNCRDAPGSGAQ